MVSKTRPVLRVCGDWEATTGLAEAARRLAVALQHEGVEIAVSSFSSGAPQEPWLFPHELEEVHRSISSCLSLWTLNINELHQVPDDEMHRSSHNIARWFWEFPTIPKWMHPQFDRVSEIWAPTKFVQRAMMRYTSKTVLVVPPVVPIFPTEGSSAGTRDRLGLPQKRVVFLISFDYNSTVSRKNPFGAIEAFSRAFPGGRAAGPLLVIKVINLDRDPTFERHLRDAAERVSAVIIARHMTSQQLGDLFHASDVYVSLHRSEGFGLGLAESMAIGKPVIGTAYSGNLDFMSVDNSCLVGYRLRPMEDADYLYNVGMAETYVPGALWAEPDLDEAAQWMDLLAADEEYRRHVGSTAVKTISSGYSEAAVAAAARERLSRLWE